MKSELKRLTVEININLHTEFKKLAVSRNISMKTAVIRAINDYIVNERKFEKKSQ